jgi:hypothetical protein
VPAGEIVVVYILAIIARAIPFAPFYQRRGLAPTKVVPALELAEIVKPLHPARGVLVNAVNQELAMRPPVCRAHFGNIP